MPPLKLTASFANLGESFSSTVEARPMINPRLVCTDSYCAGLLGLNESDLQDTQFADYFGGNKGFPNTQPVAMVYAGHQFGGFSPQLGDGRGLLLGEYSSENGLLDVHLKGAGKTPYSRFGDGYAVLRSCIREYLASIAMHGLGIDTSHALCIVRGDNPVTRETIEPAAILTRIAKSHIRFGSFEYFYHSNNHKALEQLAQYTLSRYLPQHANDSDRFDTLFRYACTQTAKMIAKWQAVGFCHGVMNTDNFSIIGETIDYGPFGFMEKFNAHHICNHSDHQGRYAFNQQPSVGLWNLKALHLALSPLLSAHATEAFELYEESLNETFRGEMYKKLGWLKYQEGDETIVSALFSLMHKHALDYTLFFRSLTNLCEQQLANLAIPSASTLSTKALDVFCAALEVRPAAHQQDIKKWLEIYVSRWQKEPCKKTQILRMNKANPWFTLRNYYAQLAIDEAYEEEKYDTLTNLAKALSDPFNYQEACKKFAVIPPTSCSNIAVSCSS